MTHPPPAIPHRSPLRSASTRRPRPAARHPSGCASTRADWGPRPGQDRPRSDATGAAGGSRQTEAADRAPLTAPPPRPVPAGAVSLRHSAGDPHRNMAADNAPPAPAGGPRPTRTGPQRGGVGGCRAGEREREGRAFAASARATRGLGRRSVTVAVLFCFFF